MRRLGRILLRLVVWTVLVLAGAVVAGVLWISSDSGNSFIRDQIHEAAAPAFPNGSFSIGVVDTDLLTHFDLREVEIRDAAGKALVSLGRVRLAYSLSGLMLGKVVVDEVLLEQPKVDLTVDESGEMDILAVFGPAEPAPEVEEPTEPFSGLPVDVELNLLSISDGSVAIADPAGDTLVPSLNFRLSASVQGSTVTVSGIDVDVDVDMPVDQTVRLDGGLTLDDGDLALDLDALRFGDIAVAISGGIDKAETRPVLGLSVVVDPIDPGTVEALAGESMLREPGRLEMAITGPLSDLGVAATLTSESKQGELGLTVAADLEADPMAWSVALEPNDFAVHVLTSAVPEPFVLNGRYAVSGSGTDYPKGVSAKITMEGSDQNFAGELVESLGIHGALDAGQLELTGLSVKHSAADITVSGAVDLVASQAKLELDADIPDASALQKYGAEDLGGHIHFGGSLIAGWDPEVSADLDGALSLVRFKGPGITIADGGGPIKAVVRGDAAEGSGSITLNGLNASGTEIDTISLTFAGGQGASGGIDLEAELGIGTIAMPDGQFDMAGLSGTLVASVPAGGDPAAEANLNVETFRFGDEGYAVDGGPVVFSMDGDSIAADIDLRREDAPFLAGQIRGDLASGEWKVEGFRFAVIKDDGMNAEQNISFRLAEGGAEDVHFEIANADGKGRLSMVGNATAEAPDLHLKADKIDLGYIMDMVDQIVDLSGAAEEQPADGPDQPAEPPVAAAVAGKPEGSTPGAEESDGKKDAPSKEGSSGGDAVAVEPDNPLEGLTGKASMDLKIKGDGDKIQASGWVSIDDFVMANQVDGIDTRVDLEFTETHAKLHLRVGDDKKTFFWAKGAVPVEQDAGVVTLDCDGAIKLRSFIPGIGFKQLVKKVPALSGVDGRLSMDIDVSGEACNPDLSLVAALDTPVGPQGERVRLDIQFERDGDTLESVTLVEQENQRIARIGIELATTLSDALQAMLREGKEVDMANPRTWLKEFDVRFALLGADLGRMARMGEVGHPVRGILAGGVKVSGTMDQPHVESGMIVVDGQIGESEVEQFTVGFVEDGDGYKLDTVLAFRDEGALHIDGFLPLDLKFDEDMDLSRPGLDIRFSGDGLPMSLGAGPSGITKATGSIGLQGGVTGTLENPVPRFKLISKDAGFTLLPTALRYDPIDVDIDYAPDGVSIHKLKIQTSQVWGAKPGSGFFSLNGDVRLGDDGPERMDLKLKMDEFWLSSTRAAAIATSGKVDISGHFPELLVNGKIKLDEASIAVGSEVLKDTSSFDVDESIKIHREDRKVVARKKDEEEAGPSIADEMTVALDVDLNSKVRLKADVPMSEDFGAQFAQLAALSVDLGLDGRLKIAQSKGTLSMLGELQTLRGEAVAMGKRFAITEGTVTFTGENYANPQLNLGAAHQVGQYGSVEIKIGGDVENTAMELSSPEYPDQTDVMSMLLFGKPTNAMSETEGESGAGLLSAAMASVGGQAARSTGAAFLQNVQIDPGSGSVKVGFPLTDKVYLSIERVRPEADTDNMTQAAVEWLLSRAAYGEVVTGDRGKSSGDVYLRWRF